MDRFRTFVFMGGGAIVFVVLALMIVMVMPTAARAQESAAEVTIGPLDYLKNAGPGGWIVVLLAAACVVLTVVGAVAVRKEGAWPHWRRLVRGLGEGAFLVGLLAALNGTRMAFDEIVLLGATVTPADLAEGLSLGLVRVVLGTAAALLSLVGAGVIRLGERPVRTG